jgi:biopolymer transport protein ExbD
MGMQTGKEGRTVMSEINVTPFVDVMLVLLVIFMVTTPYSIRGGREPAEYGVPAQCRRSTRSKGRRHAQ